MNNISLNPNITISDIEMNPNINLKCTSVKKKKPAFTPTLLSRPSLSDKKLQSKQAKEKQHKIIFLTFFTYKFIIKL